jgi:hypothetical protein
MKTTLLAVAIAASAFATPAFAEWFIVREGTGPCRVVETRPTTTTIVVVGNKGYTTRAEADKDLTVVCK